MIGSVWKCDGCGYYNWTNEEECQSVHCIAYRNRQVDLEYEQYCRDKSKKSN